MLNNCWIPPFCKNWNFEHASNARESFEFFVEPKSIITHLQRYGTGRPKNVDELKKALKGQFLFRFIPQRFQHESKGPFPTDKTNIWFRCQSSLCDDKHDKWPLKGSWPRLFDENREIIGVQSTSTESKQELKLNRDYFFEIEDIAEYYFQNKLQMKDLVWDLANIL